MIDCRGYMVTGFMHVCDNGDYILGMIECRNNIVDIYANMMMSGGITVTQYDNDNDDDNFNNNDNYIDN